MPQASLPCTRSTNHRTTWMPPCAMPGNSLLRFLLPAVDEDIYRISQDKLNLNELVLGDAGREGSASEGRGGRDANSRLIGDISRSY